MPSLSALRVVQAMNRGEQLMVGPIQLCSVGYAVQFLTMITFELVAIALIVGVLYLADRIGLLKR